MRKYIIMLLLVIVINPVFADKTKDIKLADKYYKKLQTDLKKYFNPAENRKRQETHDKLEIAYTLFKKKRFQESSEYLKEVVLYLNKYMAASIQMTKEMKGTKHYNDFRKSAGIAIFLNVEACFLYGLQMKIMDKIGDAMAIFLKFNKKIRYKSFKMQSEYNEIQRLIKKAIKEMKK